MKDSVDLLKGFYDLLRKRWPNIKMLDKDYEHIKDEDRPCIILEFDDLSDGYLTNQYLEQNTTIHLYYFAKERQKGYVELLKKQKELTEVLLKPLALAEGFVVTVYGVDYDIDRDDMVLMAIFDTYTVQELPENEGEPMEELYLEGE